MFGENRAKMELRNVFLCDTIDRSTRTDQIGPDEEVEQWLQSRNTSLWRRRRFRRST